MGVLTVTRGLKRIPTAKLLASGSNVGKRRAETEAKLPPASTDAPSHLDGVALEKWNELAPCLSESGMMTKPDRDTLAAYCEAWESYLHLKATVKDEGWTITGAMGSTMKNPNAALLGETQTSLLRLQQELGITPASRSRVTVTKEPDKKNSILRLVRAK